MIVSRLAIATAALAALNAAPRGPATAPTAGVAGILDAFRTHAIVAFGEVHGEEQGHAFRLALIRHPSFPGLVNDIVVEYGNARYQATVDRFTAGGDVPDETLRQVWRNTTIPDAIWDRPIYEEFFRAVRSVNAARSRLSPALCAEGSYREMRVRRMALRFGTEAAAARALDAECSEQTGGIPDFSGTWKHANAGQSLPHPPPPPPAPPGGSSAPPPPPPPLRTVELKITQTAAEIRIERTAADRDRNVVTVSIYKLDGTESTNQMGPIVATTRAAWEGRSLVLLSTYRAGEKRLGDGRETLALDGANLVVEHTRNLPVGRVSGKDLYFKDR